MVVEYGRGEQQQQQDTIVPQQQQQWWVVVERRHGKMPPQPPHHHARQPANGRLIEAEVDAHRRKNPTPRSRARLIVDPRPTVREVFSARR